MNEFIDQYIVTVVIVDKKGDKSTIAADSENARITLNYNPYWLEINFYLMDGSSRQVVFSRDDIHSFVVGRKPIEKR